MKWGLFGGTLDPIHLGHLRVAEELSESLGLDAVVFIPAALPPHKTDRDITFRAPPDDDTSCGCRQ